MGANARIIFPSNAATQLVARNVAASNVVGMNWDGASIGPKKGNPRNPEDRNVKIVHYNPITPDGVKMEPAVFEENTMYKNTKMAMYFRGSQCIVRLSLDFGPR